MIYNSKTLEKWEEYYRKNRHGRINAQERSDSGKTRVLNKTAIEEIYRLKEMFPRINATLIYTKLIRRWIY